MIKIKYYSLQYKVELSSLVGQMLIQCWQVQHHGKTVSMFKVIYYDTFEKDKHCIFTKYVM